MSSSQTEIFTQSGAIEMMEMELEMKEFSSCAQSETNLDAQQRLLDTQAQVDEVVGGNCTSSIQPLSAKKHIATGSRIFWLPLADF